MKNFIKGLVLGALVGSIVAILVVIGFKVKDNQRIEIKRTVTQSEEGIHLDEGEIFIELTDESFIIINEEKNIYEFQPVDLGDWSYELNNKEELENIVQTYMSMKNNGSF